MRRLLVLIVLVGAGVAAVATASAGSDDPSRPTYTIELDNAFGVTEGADVKVAGVRAGRVSGMRVDRKSKRALVDITIDKTGFGSLRTDAFCETRPQSLIGEYFVDCRPGTAAEGLKPGATLPVEQTASTIPLDLINNIMRRPYRERLAIILNELGAGVGGRSTDIQATLKRAVPALRETDQVLAILAEQNKVLANLTRDADAGVGRAPRPDRRQPAAPADVPARARADDGQARRGHRRPDARARRPQPVRGAARDAAGEPAGVRRREPHRLHVARR